MSVHRPSPLFYRFLLAGGWALSLAGGVLLDQRLRVAPLVEFHDQANTIFGEVANQLLDYEAMMDTPYDTFQIPGIITKSGQQGYLDNLQRKPGLKGSIQWLKASPASDENFCKKWSDIETDETGNAGSVLLWHLPVPGSAKLAKSQPVTSCVGALEVRYVKEELFAHLFKSATAKGLGVRIDARGAHRSAPDNIYDDKPRIFVQGVQGADNSPLAKETNFAFFTDRLHVVLFAPLEPWNSVWPGLALSAVGCVLSWALYRSTRRRDERNLQDYGHKLGLQQRGEELTFIARQLVHEVGQPLTGCLGCLESLLLRLNRGDIPAEVLARDLPAAFRFAQSARDFLNETREQIVSPGTGQPRPVEVGEIFRSVLALAKVDSRFHDINLAVRGGGSDLCVMASTATLEMILLNLLRNSAEAIRDEGKGGSVSLEARAEDEWVKILVADDGPGISQPDGLFQPFRSTKGYGTGFGLFFCKLQVEHFGGSIMGGNRPEGGAWFEVALPACPEQSRTIPTP